MNKNNYPKTIREFKYNCLIPDFWIKSDKEIKKMLGCVLENNKTGKYISLGFSTFKPKTPNRPQNNAPQGDQTNEKSKNDN